MKVWRRHKTARRSVPGTYSFGPHEIEPVGGSYAASLIERGGLEVPAALRSSDGDLFAQGYFAGEVTRLIEGDTQAHRDFQEIAGSLPWKEEPLEFEAELNRRVAERMLLRFREWQKRSS